MKELKKITIGVVSICVLLVVVDWVVGTWSEKMYYQSKYGIFRRQIYCLTESQDELMILGSSRAAHHYVPQVFEDSLGMSCYNAGSDGMCIYYHYGILASRIQRGCPPKMVILEVIGTDVEVSQGATFTLDAALDRYAPHYGEFAEIDSLFVFNGWKEKVKLMSKTYKYNSKLVQTIKCNYIPWPEDRGYESLSKVMKVAEGEKTADVLASSSDELHIEERKLEYLQKCIDDCKANDIKLVMCYSPYYGQTVPKSNQMIEELAKANGVKFLNYGDDLRFQKPEYFQDASHLNDTGAKEYSKEITYIIEKLNNDNYF
ncbi:MAG: hypothetical protein IJ341_13215 [Bacteroidales bacterium]|nr:hypothetical protein [Bacteroidales bacterium]MBQ7820636.1 hypothetical protein [Bacteroidales bacterium]